AVAVEDENGKKSVKLEIDSGDMFGLNSWSSGQLASYSEVPKAYFDRLALEKPALLADNINHGFDRNIKKSNGNESRLLRTLDGNVRGLLSSRYRILDAHDMLE